MKDLLFDSGSELAKALKKETEKISAKVRAQQLLGDKSPFFSPKQSSSTTTTTEPVVVLSWNIQVVPYKKYTVGQLLLPSAYGTVTRHFIFRKRILRIEIHGPSSTTSQDDDSCYLSSALSSRFPVFGRDPGYLGNEHIVLDEGYLANEDFVLFVCYATGKAIKTDELLQQVSSSSTTPTPTTTTDHDNDNNQEEEVEKLSNRDKQKLAQVLDDHDLIELVSYRMDHVEILNQQGNVCEVKVLSLGDNHEKMTVIRDLFFESSEECQLFCRYIQCLRQLEEQRCQRQVQAFQQKNNNNHSKNHHHKNHTSVIATLTPPPKEENESTTTTTTTVPPSSKQQQSPSTVTVSSSTLSEAKDASSLSLSLSLSTKQQQQQEQINLLIEIVSATGLPLPSSDLLFSSSFLDTYVVVKMYGNEIHRTKPNSSHETPEDPIWTLDTGCLFLLQCTPAQFFSCTDGMELIVKQSSKNTMGVVGSTTTSSSRSSKTVGVVRVGLEEILKSKGQRTEYEIELSQKHAQPQSQQQRTSSKQQQQQQQRKASKVTTTTKKKCCLYLRIKEASNEDIEFMKIYEEFKNYVGIFAEETYAAPTPPKFDLLKLGQTKLLHQEQSPLLFGATTGGEQRERVLRRVRPYPDPARPEAATKWMTTEQIENESRKYSTNWMASGSGDLGTLYVEVIGCDNVPNMDLIRTTNILDKSHCFVNVVYEDAVLNTDVIQDCLSPRWLPWMRRAFCFPILHPQSHLYIGIFDYDLEKSPVQMALRLVKTQHNPIGRCVVNLSNFLPETIYTVTYPFYYGELEEQRKKPRGKITLRLRIEWKDPRRAVPRALKPPPHIVVSCARKKHWEVAHYTINGAYDDRKYSMNTFARYITELQSYEKFLPYLQEFLLTVWLWRGHFPLTIFGRTVCQLPLHSITAFTWGILISRDFNVIPSFFMFCIGWAFLASNEYARMTPSPWHMRRGYLQLLLVMLFGSHFTDSIEPDENIEEMKEFEKKNQQREKRFLRAKELRADYMKKLKEEFGMQMNAATAERIGAVSNDTVPRRVESIKDTLNLSPLKPVLYPIQLRLRRVVLQLRIVSSTFLWVHTYYAFWITTLSFLGCIVMFWIPWARVLRTFFKIVIFTMLGPWMKLVDHFFFNNSAELSDDEFENEIKTKLEKKRKKVLRSIFDYQNNKERAAKLASMKRFLYGKYHITIPYINLNLLPDIPSPESFAEEYNRKTAKPIHVTDRRFGQHLVGDMIPQREIPFTTVDRKRLRGNIRHFVSEFVTELPKNQKEATTLLGQMEKSAEKTTTKLVTAGEQILKNVKETAKQSNYFAMYSMGKMGKQH